MSSVSASALRAIARVSARESHLIGVASQPGGQAVHEADKVGALLHAVAVLDAVGVPYALIGAVAVGLHSGVPRATLDTNLAVHSSHRDAALVARFQAAGFDLRGEFQHSVNFRHASGEPVQLAFDAAFDAMIERAAAFDVDGVSVRVVTKDDLIEMKRRAAAAPGRRRSKALRDQADIELLLGDVPDADEGW